MGMFGHLTRRKFLQGAATGAATLGASGVALLRPGRAARTVPPGKKLFNDIELSYLQDSTWGHAPLWLSDHLKAEAGVSIGHRQQYDGTDAVASILPQLHSGVPRLDWIQFPSLFFGTFAETGQLEPLDPYLEKYKGTSEYLDWVMPAYREFYTRWSGKTYGLMLDGDIHMLHYRKSFFERPELQRKYSKRFQRDLSVPTTWFEFLDATQFFTEELGDSEGVYGSSMVINPPNFGWGFWMNVAAGNGVNYFDENMNPGINTARAVEALDLFREIVRFGPPGKESLDISTSIQRWQATRDVMSIWWSDLAEFTVQEHGVERVEDQRADIVPGWPQEDGSTNHRAISLWCRTGAIPKNAPEEAKEAAFYFLYRMSHPDYSDEIVADEYCGSDPFGKSHYTDRAARKYLLPNPQRGITETWPSNSGIFRNLETARNILDAGLKNVEVGYPQFFWEGASAYGDALGRNIRKAVAGELTSRQALDEAAEEWIRIVQRLGINSQKSQYANFVEGARSLGYRL